MGRRRRKAGQSDHGIAGEIVDMLIDLAREAPGVGLCVSAGMFVIGAFLFWGDAARWGGAGWFVGMILLLLGGTVGVYAVVGLLRDGMGWVERSRDTFANLPITYRESERPLVEADVPTFAAPPPRDGQAFERTVAGQLRLQGYVVEETGTHGQGGDRGVDLLLRLPDAPGAPKICVQCKDYAAWKVGAEAVRAFAGAIALRGPGHVGWIVTTGRFTADAVRDARQLKIRLIDGEAWRSMTRSPRAQQPAAPPLAAQLLHPMPPRPARVGGDVPLCPRCRIAMVRRDPRPGGKQYPPFWGCANYPRCRATVDIA